MRTIRDWNPSIHAPHLGGDVVWTDDSNGKGWLVYLVRDGHVDRFAPHPDYYHDPATISDERALEMLQATAQWEGLDPEQERPE